MLHWLPLALALGLRAAVPALARRWPAWRRLGPGLNLTVALALVATILVHWVGGFYRVGSGSMNPTLPAGSLCLVSRLGWELRRGDVVLCGPPADPRVPPAEMIKRVVAMEGDRIAIRGGQVTLNGQPLDEPYADRARGGGPDLGEQTVPAGTVFLLGDCRYNSIDSRAFGPFPRAEVRGRVVWGLR